MTSLQDAVDELDWWHQIDLGQGVVTPGRDDSKAKLTRLQLASDLSGLRVLDIGAWDGFFSFEAERRGADVVALDLLAWQRGPKSGRPCFELARRALSSKVEDITLDVMDLSADKVGQFDLVLCLGVLYHLREPFTALEHIAKVTRNQLILETHADAQGYPRPAMVFYPGSELNDDPSNWWGPNELALRTMLKDVGFTRVDVVHKRSLAARLGRALLLKLRGGASTIRGVLAQDRIVIHAFK